MTIQEAINLSINAGWNQKNALEVFKGVDAMVLDPQFWQCLSKAMKWKLNDDGFYEWHNFIDYLAKGKTAEDYFNQLQ